MKVLQLNKELLALYDVLGVSDSRPWKIKLRRQIIVTAMLICLLCGWSFSMAFIIMYLKTDLQNALYAIFQVAAEFSANYTVLIACLYPKLIDTVFVKLNYVRENGK